MSLYLCCFCHRKDKKVEFVSLVLNASYLSQAFIKAIKYVQLQCFGPAMTSLSEGSSDDYKAIVHKMKRHATNSEQTRRVNELQYIL